MKEIWKDIKGWIGLYQVSNSGRIRSLPRFVEFSDGRKRTFPSITKRTFLYPNGYCGVELKYRGRKRKSYLVHRLVAIAFIPNPKRYEHINHKDGVKDNNASSNLEWCNRSHNIIHAFDIGLIKTKKVVQKTLDGEVIATWKSGIEINRKLGFLCSSISNCCNGRTETSYGYK